MSRSIVFIGHYSGGKKDFDSRHYFFAKELTKLGYRATMINAAYSHRIHNAKVIEQPYVKFYDDEICFISVKTPFYKGNGAKRIINMLSFTNNLIKYSKNILNEIGDIDYVVMATPHPFQFFGAKFISARSKAKLIIDVKDIWPLSITELMRVSRFHPFILLLRLTEVLMYRYSDSIMSPLSNINEYFKDNDFNKKASHVPTGLDLEYYDSIDEKSFFIKLPKDKFIIGYIGGITISNAIDFLLDTASYFKERNKDIVFLIVGNGANKDNLVKKYNDSNIIYLDAVTKEEAFYIMKNCDLLYRASPNLDLYKYGISPLKINEYMYSCVPILHVFNFEEHDIVKKVGCGISVRYRDINGLIEAINKFYNMLEKDRLKIGLNGKSFVKENLFYSKISKKLVSILS